MFGLFKKEKKKIKLNENQFYLLGDRYLRINTVHKDGRVTYHIMTINLSNIEIIGGNATEELLQVLEYMNDPNEYDKVDSLHKFLTGKSIFKKYQTKSKYYHLIIPEHEYIES